MSIATTRPDSPEASAFRMCLLGTSLGDAIGLPREGLSPRRAQRMFGGPPLEHQFFLGRGAVSDDTEHACLAAQALIASAGDASIFTRELARRLRWWLLTMPAGIGLATLRSICKLWLGISPKNSGVWSAGNGPAMRAAIIGLYARDDLVLLKRLIRASTRITHTDPRAEQGALVVALAAAYSISNPTERLSALQFLESVDPHVEEVQLASFLRMACEFADRQVSAEELAAAMGLRKGVSGFINHTVPVAIFCWLRHQDDFRTAIESAVCLGGDSDTVGAIVGGLIGIRSHSVGRIIGLCPPESWVQGLVARNSGPAWLRLLNLRGNFVWAVLLAEQLAQVRQSGQPQVPESRNGLVAIVRNSVFGLLVLSHGLRRLFPPY